MKFTFFPKGIPSIDDFLTISEGLSSDKILEKLIETTTDVFFNVPSVLTADLWSKYSSAFFYQFDHVGESEPSGIKFLKPLPLVSKRTSKSKIAHGDELGYLFEVKDVFGNKIGAQTLKSKRDKEARKNFVEIIQQFAYLNSSAKEFKIGDKVLSTFRADATNFIKISEKLDVTKDFRFCQLKLWGVPLKETQKLSCAFLSEGLKQIPLVSKIRNFGEVTGGSKFGLV